MGPNCVTFQGREVFSGVMDRLLEGATKVDILGLTLVGAIAGSQGCFEAIAADPSKKLRFIIVHPDSYAMKAAAGFWEPLNLREYNIAAGLELLRALIYDENNKQRPNVEAKLTRIAPSFSLVITDLRMQVELYGHDIPPDERLHFDLTPDNNKELYDFFQSQFDKFWKTAVSFQEWESKGKAKPPSST